MGEIKTYTGIMFDPLKPQEALIRIEDIAHALSMLCRANGHFKSFYSVGQHCINCAREAAVRGYSRRVQLGCLLHDGSEAYLSDVTRPVKQVMPMYLEIEEPLQTAIWNKWLQPALTEEEIRSRSHRPQDYYAQPHFMPEYRDGEAILQLNRVRCAAREAELRAVAAFTDRDGVPTRVDILRALNRMSSMLYILMIRLKKEQ